MNPLRLIEDRRQQRERRRNVFLSVNARAHGRCEARLIGCDDTGELTRRIDPNGPDTAANTILVCVSCDDGIGWMTAETRAALGLGPAVTA